MFINYRRPRGGIAADAIWQALAERLGTDDVFLDVADIQPGEKWRARLREELEGCQVFVAVIDPDWLDLRFTDPERQGQRRLDDEEDWVRQEIETALRLDKPIIPVLAPPGSMPPREALPGSMQGLADCQAQELHWGPQGKGDLAQLVEAVLRHLGQLRVLAQTPDIWLVPHQKNVYFTGRDKLLAQLRADLDRHGRAALAGNGGIGKTQAAVEYAFRHAPDYSAVLWASAESESSLISGYVEIAARLGLPQTPTEPEKTIAAVVAWLDDPAHRGWLLVIDNVDHPRLLQSADGTTGDATPDDGGHAARAPADGHASRVSHGPTGSLLRFLPHHRHGHVLITSRLDGLSALGIERPLRVEKLSPQDSLDFLLRRSGRPWSTFPTCHDAARTGSTFSDAACPATSPHGHVGNVPHDEELAAAARLAVDLDGLPLALEQAGAYLARHSIVTLAEYVRRRGDLLDKLAPELGGYRKTVASTWLPSFAAVRESCPAAAELLNFLAFLAPDDIPLELLTLGRAELGDELSAALASADEGLAAVSELLEPLARYSLIELDVPTATLSIHRLVQEVLRKELPRDAQRTWAERTVNAIDAAFPSVEFAKWPLCRRLLPHALAASKLIEDWSIETQRAGRLLTEAGCFIKEQGRYGQAEPLYRRALAILEMVLGPNHPDVATSLSNLADLYCNKGRYTEAEPLYTRALAMREEYLGHEHPDTATILQHLADLYRAQARYAVAQRLAARALAIRENVIGSDHPDTAASLTTLAALYCDQGRYAEAAPLYARALAIRERVLGHEHPETAASLNNVAGVYYAQGWFMAALPLYARALAIFERTLGSHHPETATSLSNLAGLYFQQGHYGDAKLLYNRALAIQEEALGPEHPDTGITVNNLAFLYHVQGRYAEAELMYVRAVAIFEKSLGSQHPYLPYTLDNYAALLRTIGRPDQAKEMEVRSRAIRNKGSYWSILICWIRGWLT